MQLWEQRAELPELGGALGAAAVIAVGFAAVPAQRHPFVGSVVASCLTPMSTDRLHPSSYPHVAYLRFDDVI